MDTGSIVVIASDHPAVVAAIQQSFRRREVVVHHTAPHLEDVLRAVEGATKALVVVHVCKSQGAWITLVAGIRSRNPRVRLIGVGNTSDIGPVAQGIVHGLDGYVPLMPTPTASDVADMLAATLSGEEPPTDSVYARVKAMLPLGPFASGRYRNPFGVSFSQAGAVKQCLALGLAADETARHLKVTQREMLAITRCSDPGALPEPDTSCGASQLLAGLGFIAAGLLVWSTIIRPA